MAKRAKKQTLNQEYKGLVDNLAKAIVRKDAATQEHAAAILALSKFQDRLSGTATAIYNTLYGKQGVDSLYSIDVEARLAGTEPKK